MITAEHEQARPGTGPDFADVVALDFCDPDSAVFGLAWLTRLPGRGAARANLTVFVDGELVEDLALELAGGLDDWRDARVDGFGMSTVEPLESWRVAVRGGRVSVDLDATAVTGPRELADATLARTTGIEQYEQLCTVAGTVEAGGRAHPVRGLGRRVHSWGEPAWGALERWRTLYAASAEGRAISVTSALPRGAAGHGDELTEAHPLDVDDPQPYEDVRLSSVYDAGGLPVKAGLELWMPGDEFPRRLGGEVVCATRAERRTHDLVVSFFRWSIDGVPAYGCYELVRHP